MRVKKPFLVTGHPRCGTGTMSKLFKLLGYDVGHERMGRDGVSSWLYSVDTPTVPFHSVEKNIGRSHFAFRKIVLVVRNPFDAFASVAYTECRDKPGQFGYKGLKWRSEFVDIDLDADRFTQAAQSLIGWYEIFKDQHYDCAVQVENAHVQLPEFLGLPPMKHAVIENTRWHPAMSMDEISDRIPDHLMIGLNELAERFGYVE